MYAYCLNNPLNLLDKSGQDATAGVMEWTTGIGLGLSLLDGPLPILDFIAVAGIAVVGAITLSESIFVTKEVVIAEATTVAKSEPPKGQYTVYFLRQAGDSSNRIVYVGRVKTVNFQARMRYHQIRGREYVERMDGPSYEVCRAVEQGSMMYHHTIVAQNPLNNQIRGISPYNKKGLAYLSAAFNFAQSDWYMGGTILPASYWANVTENEFLNAGM